MRIPWWIWVVIGLSVISWVIPDGIPGEEFILPAIAIGSLLLRRHMLKGFYQQQYQRYQGATTGRPYGTAGAGSGQGTGTGSSNFYNRFKGWGQGFGPQGTGDSVKNPYDVLGVKKGASQDAIKKAYRAKLKKFHPDVVENLKLGPEYKEMFEEKTREIHKAYQTLGGK